jgi:hypothetical protein
MADTASWRLLIFSLENNRKNNQSIHDPFSCRSTFYLFMKTLIKTELQNGAYHVGKSSHFKAGHQANARQKAKSIFSW